jgi:hypothetical protein
METIIQQIRDYVEHNRLEDALDLLLANASAAQKDEVSVLKRNLSGLEREKRIGAIDFREYAREAVKISSAILDMARQLPKTSASAQTAAPAPPPVVAPSENTARTRPYKVFISYAREDEAYVQTFKSHLRGMEIDGLIAVWTDAEILASEEWRLEIQKQIDQTDIMLLLMSPDFINSDFIQKVELKQALERRLAGTTLVVPVNLRRVGLPEFLSRLQRTPRETPIASAADQDEAWYQVSLDLKKLIKSKFEDAKDAE